MACQRPTTRDNSTKHRDETEESSRLPGSIGNNAKTTVGERTSVAAAAVKCETPPKNTEAGVGGGRYLIRYVFYQLANAAEIRTYCCTKYEYRANMWRFREPTTTRDDGTKMKQRRGVLARQQSKALRVDERTAAGAGQ